MIIRSILLLGLSLSVPAVGIKAQVPDLYDETRLHTIQLTFTQQGWWEQLRKNYGTGTYIRADLEMLGVTLKDVGVRFRGNSSYQNTGTSLKKPFEIATDAFVPDQELFGYKTLNLNNGFKDPTFVREVLAYHAFRLFIPAPRANYIRLVLNNESWGVYINVQQVNKDLLRSWFTDVDGNRYRGENDGTVPMYRTGLIWLGKDREPYTKSYQLKSDLKPSSWIDLIHMIDVLNNTPAAQLPEALPEVLDVDEALRFIAVLNTFLALDSYLSSRPHNFYLYNDDHHERFSILPWDLNAAFAVDNLGMSYPATLALSPFYMETNGNHPLIKNLLAHPPWRARYLAHCRTILSRVFDWNVLEPLVNAYQDLIEAEMRVDTKKLYDFAHFRGNITSEVKVTMGGKFYFFPALKHTVQQRRQFLLQHEAINKPAPSITLHDQIPARPGPGEEVWILGEAQTSSLVQTMTLHHRVQGMFTEVPMLDDGLHHDKKAGDGIHGGRIPPQAGGVKVEYYLSAAAPAQLGGAVSFHPEVAGRAPCEYTVKWPTRSSDVIITEFLAINDHGIRDERGEREDWIELTNTGTAAVVLDGHYLTDDLTRPGKWKFPTGTTLSPGKSLLIWADGEENEGPLHTSFKLRGAGEVVALFAPDGHTCLDSFAFGLQWPDRSTGRMALAPQVWVTFAAPGPGAPNLPDPCGHLAYSSLGAHLPLHLKAAAIPGIGKIVLYEVHGAPQDATGLLLLGLHPESMEIDPIGTLLVCPPVVPFPLETMQSEIAVQAILIPRDTRLIGVCVYFQAGMSNGLAGGFSSGVLTRICQ